MYGTLRKLADSANGRLEGARAIYRHAKPITVVGAFPTSPVLVVAKPFFFF